MATFANTFLRFGLDGLNLRDAADLLSPLQTRRLSNLYVKERGAWTVRPGMTALATSPGILVHSIARLNDPDAGSFTRIWGIDGDLYLGASGALTLIDSGYSGSPLTFAQGRPPLSGESWMFVADQDRMRKVRSDGLDLPIGLPAPSAAVTTALAAVTSKTINDFSSNAGWTALAGTGGVTAVPTVVAGKDGNALRFLSVPGAATAAYYNFWAVGLTLDLSTFGGGVDATDDDLMHLWLRVDRPDRLQEVVVYLVCSSGFSAAETSPPGVSTVNTDAFFKAFRSSDFSAAVEQTQSVLDTVDTETIRRAIELGLDETTTGPAARRNNAIEDRIAARPSDRLRGEQVASGRDAWTEFGVVGLPLRRGDFVRIGGEAETRGWDTITGLVVLVRVATPTVVNVTLDHFYIYGGYGLDASDPAASPYDVKATHYDPRTGAEGNGSPEQAATAALNPARGRITATPAAAYGDAAVRQRFYIRGGIGPIQDDWYFAGVNTSDGGAFTIDETDLELVTSGTIPTTHYQPVPTVNAAGTTVLAEPVPSIWGPSPFGQLFACGDPYRPGHVYFCLPGQYDHWAAGSTGVVEVCAPSEQLMHGCIWGGQSYVFSRERLYMLVPGMSGDGSISPQSSECRKGLISRYGLAVGPAIFFVSNDGVYLTTGGPAQSLTDATLWPLFHGQEVEDFHPIDFTEPDAIRLQVYDNELWFHYLDTGGVRRTLIYGLMPGQNFWRPYFWQTPVATIYSEDLGDNQWLMLLGGRSTGAGYLHSGVTDLGTAIPWHLRTGALDEGLPAVDKLYAGDLTVDADRGGTTITAIFYANFDASPLGTSTITSGSGRTRSLLNTFPTPILARNLTLELSSAGSTSAAASVYWAGWAYLPQARDHIRWQTERLDHGIHGWQVPLDLNITLRAVSTVTLQVVAYNAEGVVSGNFSYTIPSTSAKVKRHVELHAMKGVLFEYILTSEREFRVFWHESEVTVMPWGAPEDTKRYVLGAETGAVMGVDPGAAAARAGGA